MCSIPQVIFMALLWFTSVLHRALPMWMQYSRWGLTAQSRGAGSPSHPAGRTFDAAQCKAGSLGWEAQCWFTPNPHPPVDISGTLLHRIPLGADEALLWGRAQRISLPCCWLHPHRLRPQPGPPGTAHLTAFRDPPRAAPEPHLARPGRRPRRTRSPPAWPRRSGRGVRPAGCRPHRTGTGPRRPRRAAAAAPAAGVGRGAAPRTARRRGAAPGRAAGRAAPLRAARSGSGRAGGAAGRAPGTAPPRPPPGSAPAAAPAEPRKPPAPPPTRAAVPAPRPGWPPEPAAEPPGRTRGPADSSGAGSGPAPARPPRTPPCRPGDTEARHRC